MNRFLCTACTSIIPHIYLHTLHLINPPTYTYAACISFIPPHIPTLPASHISLHIYLHNLHLNYPPHIFTQPASHLSPPPPHTHTQIPTLPASRLFPPRIPTLPAFHLSPQLPIQPASDLSPQFNGKINHYHDSKTF